MATKKLRDLLPSFTGIIQCHCDDCGWKGAEDQLEELEDATLRVAAGEFMALGQCPKCEALISATDKSIEPYTLEIAVRIIAERGRGEVKKAAQHLHELLNANHEAREAIREAERLTAAQTA